MNLSVEATSGGAGVQPGSHTRLAAAVFWFTLNFWFSSISYCASWWFGGEAQSKGNNHSI